MGSNFLENLRDSSRNHSSVLEVWSRSIHCECLSRSCLPVAQDCSVVTCYNRLDDVFSAVGEHVFLRSVMHYLVKFKLPLLLSVVNVPTVGIFWDVNCHVLSGEQRMSIH